MTTALVLPPTVTHLRLTTMPPNDINDPERHYTPTDPLTPDTLAPPTDREPRTNPENAMPRRDAISPQGLRDSYFEEAAKNFGEALIELRLTRKEISDGFTGQGSKLDEMTREFNTNYGLLSGEFKSFRAVVEARLDDGERRFDEIEEMLKSLKKEQLEAASRQIEAADKITKLEIELSQMKTHIHARSATPSTA